MTFAKLACAFGRHRVDEGAIRHIHAGHVGRCRHCATPLEESEPHRWTVLQVHDAGMGRRGLS